MVKTVIIGSNHAGIAAANTLLDHYPDQQVVMIDKSNSLSYLGCGSPLWVGRQIDSYETLFYTNKEAFEEKGAAIHMETSVASVDFDKKIVSCCRVNGETFEETYDNLVLATGSKPINLNLPGNDYAGIHCLKTFEDCMVVDEELDDPMVQNVAVVGAGYIGVEMAEAIKRRGKNVLLFDIESQVLSAYYDAWLSEDMSNTLSENGVELHLNEKVMSYQKNDVMDVFLRCIEELVQEIKVNSDTQIAKNKMTSLDNKVSGIVTDKGEYPVDLVVNALGFTPNVDLGQGRLTLSKEKAYLVDEHQRTNLADVYAIGDCATIYSNALNEVTHIALATNAVRSGIVAGHSIGGSELKSLGVQGSNGISIFGQNMVSTGISYEKAKTLGFKVAVTDFEDLQKPSFMKDNEQVKLRIVYDQVSRRVLGAQMSSKGDMSMGIHMFSLAIAKQVTVDELALLDIFFLPHFNQPYNYITMAALSAN